MQRLPLGRRQFLAAMGAAAASTTLPPWSARRALAQASRRNFIFCYMSGGWDLTLGPDSRDPARSYAGLQLGLELLDAPFNQPLQVNVGPDTGWWGAPMAPLVPHSDITRVINGVNMNTVAHDTGRAYILTGLEPSGITARGSSIGTHVVDQAGPDGAPTLPNVAIGVPSYNQGLSPSSSGVPFSSAGDFTYLLAPPRLELPDADAESRLAAFQVGQASCLAPAGGTSLGELYADSTARGRMLIEQGISAQFDFTRDEAATTRALYGLNTGREQGPAQTAAVAAQSIKSGLAQVVTVRLQAGLDTHTGWADTHPGLLREAFDALAAMLTDLRDSTDDQGTPLIENTTVMVFSEFGRTGLLNGADSRDHNFTNSVLLFGAGVQPGIFGRTGVEDLDIVEVNLTTGQQQVGGTILLPDHIMATVLASAGLDPAPYRVDPLSTVLAGGA